MFGAALSPAGRRLATSGTEPIKVWGLVAQRELVTLQGEGQFFINPGFSPDGNTLPNRWRILCYFSGQFCLDTVKA